jgi:hypothetical protein
MTLPCGIQAPFLCAEFRENTLVIMPINQTTTNTSTDRSIGFSKFISLADKNPEEGNCKLEVGWGQ